MPDVIRPGAVAWTGDNPFIYLKTDPEGEWSALSLYFRIAASKFGPGKLSLVVENPYGKATLGTARLALTDNPELARFLIDEFVAKFGLFRPSEALMDLEVFGGAIFTEMPDGDDWTQKAVADTTQGHRSIELSWRGLGAAFAVDVPGSESGTGKHEMFAVFRIADGGEITVDGRRLPGATVKRAFLNGPAQSAGLALSETWVEE